MYLATTKPCSLGVTEGTRTADLQGHNLSVATGDGRRWAAGNCGDLDVAAASGRGHRRPLDTTCDGVGVS
jgi:hypothetical protein